MTIGKSEDLCQRLSEDTSNDVGPSEVSMPDEVKKISHAGGNCITYFTF